MIPIVTQCPVCQGHQLHNTTSPHPNCKEVENRLVHQNPRFRHLLQGKDPTTVNTLARVALEAARGWSALTETSINTWGLPAAEEYLKALKRPF